MRPSNSSIGLHDVTKRFGGVVALDRVSITFESGKVHALLGENGSGKSTAVKILSGVIRPDEGAVVLDGEAMEFHSPRQAMRHGIAAVYQENSLVPQLSVGANIMLGHEPARLGVLHGEDMDAARRWLRHVGLDIDPRVETGGLSVGVRQVVAIAKALSLEARVFIFDEPTASLTKPEADHLFELVAMLRERNYVAVYITHRLAEVQRIADTVTVLKDGKVVDTLPRDDVTEDKIVRLMVGRDLGSVFPTRAEPEEEPVLVASELKSMGGRISVGSVVLHAGEILGIAGIEGSGRSELVRMLAGIDPIRSGTITVRGRRLLHLSASSALARGIGFVPPDRLRQAVLPTFSVRSSITLSALRRLARFGVLRMQSERHEARRLQTDLAIRAPSLSAPITTLSGGNQQKVVLGKVLCAGSRVLVCDEPTAGVDVGARREIYGLLSDLAKGGAAIIVSSSDLQELLGLCHRIVVMRQGRVVGEYPAHALSEESLMRAQLPLEEHVLSEEVDRAAG